MEKDNDTLPEQEIARRRDEVIRRMANTPPQPKPKMAADASPKKRGRPMKVPKNGLS